LRAESRRAADCPPHRIGNGFWRSKTFREGLEISSPHLWDQRRKNKAVTVRAPLGRSFTFARRRMTWEAFGHVQAEPKAVPRHRAPKHPVGREHKQLRFRQSATVQRF